MLFTNAGQFIFTNVIKNYTFPATFLEGLAKVSGRTLQVIKKLPQSSVFRFIVQTWIVNLLSFGFSAYFIILGPVIYKKAKDKDKVLSHM